MVNKNVNCPRCQEHEVVARSGVDERFLSVEPPPIEAEKKEAYKDSQTPGHQRGVGLEVATTGSTVDLALDTSCELWITNPNRTTSS
jgi:chloramphenicol 3-O-phosphotransferase